MFKLPKRTQGGKPKEVALKPEFLMSIQFALTPSHERQKTSVFTPLILGAPEITEGGRIALFPAEEMLGQPLRLGDRDYSGVKCSPLWVSSSKPDPF